MNSLGGKKLLNTAMTTYFGVNMKLVVTITNKTAQLWWFTRQSIKVQPGKRIIHTFVADVITPMVEPFAVAGAEEDGPTAGLVFGSPLWPRLGSSLRPRLWLCGDAVALPSYEAAARSGWPGSGARGGPPRVRTLGGRAAGGGESS